MTEQIDPEDFAARVRRDAERWLRCAKAAMFDEATQIINKSIPITPLDNGDLRRSAFVAEPQTRGNNVTIELGYGGFASRYALAVHEMGVNPPKPINWSEPGTGAKYLEKPFDAQQRGLAGRVTRNALERMRDGNDDTFPTHPTRPR